MWLGAVETTASDGGIDGVAILQNPLYLELGQGIVIFTSVLGQDYPVALFFIFTSNIRPPLWAIIVDVYENAIANQEIDISVNNDAKLIAGQDAAWVAGHGSPASALDWVWLARRYNRGERVHQGGLATNCFLTY
jgi:hypothetical protein